MTCHFSWSLAKLADFLVAEGVVDDISHEGLRVLLRQEAVSFQRLTRRPGPVASADRNKPNLAQHVTAGEAV